MHRGLEVWQAPFGWWSGCGVVGCEQPIAGGLDAQCVCFVYVERRGVGQALLGINAYVNFRACCSLGGSLTTRHCDMSW